MKNQWLEKSREPEEMVFDAAAFDAKYKRLAREQAERAVNWRKTMYEAAAVNDSAIVEIYCNKFAEWMEYRIGEHKEDLEKSPDSHSTNEFFYSTLKNSINELKDIIIEKIKEE